MIIDTSKIDFEEIKGYGFYGSYIVDNVDEYDINTTTDEVITSLSDIEGKIKEGDEVLLFRSRTTITELENMKKSILDNPLHKRKEIDDVNAMIEEAKSDYEECLIFYIVIHNNNVYSIDEFHDW